jgi:hypothetical protein
VLGGLGSGQRLAVSISAHLFVATSQKEALDGKREKEHGDQLFWPRRGSGNSRYLQGDFARCRRYAFAECLYIRYKGFFTVEENPVLSWVCRVAFGAAMALVLASLTVDLLAILPNRRRLPASKQRRPLARQYCQFWQKAVKRLGSALRKSRSSHTSPQETAKNKSDTPLMSDNSSAKSEISDLASEIPAANSENSPAQDKNLFFFGDVATDQHYKTKYTAATLDKLESDLLDQIYDKSLWADRMFCHIKCAIILAILSVIAFSLELVLLGVHKVMVPTTQPRPTEHHDVRTLTQTVENGPRAVLINHPG